jgi:hypothetical protein
LGFEGGQACQSPGARPTDGEEYQIAFFRDNTFLHRAGDPEHFRILWFFVALF